MSWAVYIHYERNPYVPGKPWVVLEKLPDGRLLRLGAFRWSWEAIKRAQS